MWAKRGRHQAEPVGQPVGGTRTAVDHHHGDLYVPRGETWTVEGVTVHGTVRVEAGANLRLTDSTVTGHLQSAASAAVIVKNSSVSGTVAVVPRPLKEISDRSGGGTALLNTRVGADVRSTGLPHERASLILGHDTHVGGSVLTAHTDLVDHGATIRITTWNTDHLDVIDLTSDPSAAAFDVNGIAS